MNLELNRPCEGHFLKKQSFNLKSGQSDGLILQIHYSFSDLRRDYEKYKFLHSSFNDCGSHLAIADHKGYIFIINLEMEKYWQLPTKGIPTFISFPIFKNQEILIGLDNTSILLIHFETGNITGVFNGHSVPASDVSYSDDGHYYLTSCSAEAIVWDSSIHSQIHQLSLKPEVSIKKVLFMPVTNHILSCFQDDTIHVWKFGTFECLKQIIPESSKVYHLKAIALTKNGRAMVIGGHTPNLAIFCLDSWVILKIVEFPEHILGVKHLEFLSQVFDGGANKILVILTTSLEIYFFDIKTSVFLKGIHQIFGMARKFCLANNGKYLASVLTTGEVNIYAVEKVLSNSFSEMEGNCACITKCRSNQITSRNFSSSNRTQKSYESLSSVQKQLKDVLDLKKLLPILKQFGEYPESYRMLIWKTILQLPGNQEAFVSLSLKKYHSSYEKLENKYPLTNKSLCDALKKLLSNLSHWCPLFGEVDFLPEFVFPFLKLFHADPLACFEVVTTIIVNWCQNWFEFYPFPPVNLLSKMESVLGYYDPELLKFYLQKNITSSISVCSLFHTVFSEVLSKTEWLKLWDHILSNEPSFLFLAIIAYNVVCKNAIKSFPNSEELEKFFHRQNPIDMKILISKTYQFLKETPNEIHPRQFFSPFRPLSPGGTYASFLAYPKLIVDSSAEKLQSIRMEEEEILSEQLKALNINNRLDKKLKSDLKIEDQEKIYWDIEDKIRKTVEEEENRILTQRQKLRNLRQELRLKELKILEDVREKELKKRLKRKEIEFERLLRDISKKKAREKMEVNAMEEEIRKYYSELLLKKSQLEIELEFNPDSKVDFSINLEKQRQKLKDDLLELQNEYSLIHHNRQIYFSNKLASVKALIMDLEEDIAKEIAQKNSEQQWEKQEFVEELKIKVKTLEDEIQTLMDQNFKKIQKEIVEKKPKTISRKNKNLGCRTSQSTNPLKLTSRNGVRKSLRAIKTVSKKSTPSLRKITTIRARVPKIKLKNLDENKLIKSKSKVLLNDSNSKFPRSTSDQKRQKHLKSKFTFPSEETEMYTSNLDMDCKTSANFLKSTDSDSSKNIKLHRQPTGDFGNKSHTIRRNNEIENKLKCQIIDTVTDNDSENEILKSAFMTRQEIIEKAKTRQRQE